MPWMRWDPTKEGPKELKRVLAWNRRFPKIGVAVRYCPPGKEPIETKTLTKAGTSYGGRAEVRLAGITGACLLRWVHPVEDCR